MGFKEGVSLLIALFLIGFASASFVIGNSSGRIDTQYGPSEKISGWINISLKNESANSLFKDSNGNSITLLDLIKENEEYGSYDYYCNIIGCASDYEKDGTNKKNISLTLDSGQKKLVGFILPKGEIEYISSLSFRINSNAELSCYNQIEVNLLNDGSIDFINKKLSPQASSCGSLLNRGCFNISKTSEEYKIEKISTGKHCQRISFSSSPGFKLGAWIDNPNGDTRNLTMALYDLNMEEVGDGVTCKLPPVVGFGNASCKIEYSVKEPTSYYVCIYSDKAGNSTLRGYVDETSGCGFYQSSESNPEEEASFDIFAQGLAFDSVGDMNISDSSEDMTNGIKEYIESIYGSNKCPEKGCIIPILITSKKNQTLDLKNLDVVYTTGLGGTNTKDFYFIKEIPPKVSASFQKLFLDYGNFTVPNKYGNKTFKLTLNGVEILSKNIEIKKFPKINSLYPLIVPSMIPVSFSVSTNSSKNIASYSWDFNDSTPIQRTTTNRTTHTYNLSKTYQVKVDVQDVDGLNNSKTFEVLATIPKEEIGSELEKGLKQLETVKSQISKFDGEIQRGLNSILEITDLEKELKALQIEYSFITNNDDAEEGDYARIINNLSSMEIPEIVATTKDARSLPFYPMSDQVDLDVLKNVGGGTYSAEQKNAYKDAVLGWQMQNAKVTISMEEFSVIIKEELRPILTKFTIDVEKNYSDEPVYLFIKKMKDLDFKERYFEKDSGNYFYLVLDESKTTISFTTSEIINYEELPVFVSPKITSLSIETGEDITSGGGVKINWGIILLYIGILLFVAIIVYILLSVWYRRKYESHLFKNRNDLYNLISYVNISKKKGEEEEHMRESLKKAGWAGEQITYVLKKYSGKRTGMIELPLTKIIDKLLGDKEKSRQQFPGRNPIRK